LGSRNNKIIPVQSTLNDINRSYIDKKSILLFFSFLVLTPALALVPHLEKCGSCTAKKIAVPHH